MKDRLRFIFFSLGVGVAAASSVVSISLLCISLLGHQIVVHESNPILAVMEIILLVLAVGTCIVASEIYYNYLNMKRNLSAKD